MNRYVIIQVLLSSVYSLTHRDTILKLLREKETFSRKITTNYLILFHLFIHLPPYLFSEPRLHVYDIIHNFTRDKHAYRSPLQSFVLFYFKDFGNCCKSSRWNREETKLSIVPLQRSKNSRPMDLRGNKGNPGI